MIDAEMYGMIPSPKIVACDNWLAENTATVLSRSPMPPASSANAVIALGSTIGRGTCQPTR